MTTALTLFVGAVAGATVTVAFLSYRLERAFGGRS